MITSCPNCGSRFNIDPDRLSPNGRTVRCGKCAHVWRIGADGHAAGAQPAVPADATAGPPASPSDAAATQPHQPAAESAVQAEDQPIPPPPPPPPGIGLRPATGDKQKKPQAEKTKGRPLTRILVWALVIMIVVAAAVFLVNRPGAVDSIMRLIPGMAQDTMDVPVVPQPDPAAAEATETPAENPDLPQLVPETTAD